MVIKPSFHDLSTDRLRRVNNTRKAPPLEGESGPSTPNWKSLSSPCPEKDFLRGMAGSAFDAACRPTLFRRSTVSYNFLLMRLSARFFCTVINTTCCNIPHHCCGLYGIYLFRPPGSSLCIFSICCVNAFAQRKDGLPICPVKKKVCSSETFSPHPTPNMLKS